MPFLIRPSRRVPLLAVMAVAILIMLDTSSHAGLCLPPAFEKESAYHYLLSLNTSFSYAKDAVERLGGKRSTDADVEIFKVLYGLKLAKADFECAATQVSPYDASTNEAIRASANGVGAVFLRLADFQEQAAHEIELTLDAGPGEFKKGTFLERQAERAASMDETWKLLVPATIMATYSVIEEDPTTGRMSRLALTAKQRDEVLRGLRSIFGEQVTKGMKAGQISLVAAAATIYEVIGNQPRKTRDSK